MEVSDLITQTMAHSMEALSYSADIIIRTITEAIISWDETLPAITSWLVVFTVHLAVGSTAVDSMAVDTVSLNI